MYEAFIFMLGVIVGQIVIRLWNGATNGWRKVTTTVQDRNKKTLTGFSHFLREVRRAFVHFVLIALLIFVIAIFSGYISFAP